MSKEFPRIHTRIQEKSKPLHTWVMPVLTIAFAAFVVLIAWLIDGKKEDQRHTFYIDSEYNIYSKQKPPDTIENTLTPQSYIYFRCKENGFLYGYRVETQQTFHNHYPWGMSDQLIHLLEEWERQHPDSILIINADRKTKRVR